MTARARVQGRLAEFDARRGWLFADTKEPVAHDRDDDQPSYVEFGRTFNRYRLGWTIKLGRMLRCLFGK